MFIAAMATIAKLWKEPRCPSKDEWIKKMWSMYTVEYSSAIRNDEYPSFASKWMELEGIMLSEVSQSKDNHHMVSLLWGIEEIVNGIIRKRNPSKLLKEAIRPQGERSTEERKR